MVRFLLPFLAAAAAAAALLAPAGAAVLEVKVIDQDTKEPVPLAAIFVGTAARADADAQGRYRFEDLPAGEVQIRAEHVGYQPWSRTMRLYQSKVNKLSIRMKSRIQTIEPIDVMGVRPDPSVPQQTREVLASAIRRGAGTVATDPVRAIQTLPGAAAAAGDDFNNRFVIRGGDPEENLIQYDGYTLLQPIHLEGFTSVIYDDLIGGMTVYPGALPPRFGDALSSVTVFEPMQPKKRREYFRYDLGSIALGAERNDEGFKGAIAARTSFYNLVLRRPANVEERSFQDLTGRAIFALDNGLEAGATLLASRDREKGLLDRSIDAYLAAVKLGTPEGARSASVSLTASKRDRDQNLTDKNDRTTAGTKANLSRYSALGRAAWAHGASLQAGLDLDLHRDQFDGSRIDRVENTYVTTTGEHDGTGGSAAAEATWSSRLFSTSAGGRVEKIAFTKGTPVSPYLSARFRGLDWIVPGIGYRVVRQSPFPVYDNPTIAGIPVEPVDLLNAAKDEIEPLQAKHLSATLEFKAGRGFGASIEAYQKEYSHLTRWPDPLRPAPGEVTDNGDGHGRGIEISLRSDSTRYATGNLTYSVSETRKIEGPALREHPADHDRPHMVQLSLDFPVLTSTSINLFYRWSSGRPTTPFVATGDGEIPDIDRINEERLPVYSRLDVKLEHRIIGDKRDAFFYLDILNVLNRKNQGDPLFLPYDGGIIEVPTQGVRTMPIAGFGIYFY